MATRRTPSQSRKSIKATTAYAEAKKVEKGDKEAKPGPDVKVDVKGDAKVEKAEKDDKEAVKEVAKKPELKEIGKQEVEKEAKKEDAAAAPAAAPAPAVAAGPAPAAASAPAPAEPIAELALMPAPDEIPAVDPATPAPPPGPTPPGDSRSMRRHTGGREEFALVYLHGSTLVIRTGDVGQMGAWTTTEYPTHAAATRAYALECSRLVGDGFRDFYA